MLAALWWNGRRRRLLVILTFGKVGSTSMLQTLERHFPDRAVVHVHAVSRPAVHAAERPYRNAAVGGYPTNAWRGQYVRWRWRLSRRTTKREIITVVRDPIARNISVVFQINPTYQLFDEATIAGHGRRTTTDVFLNDFHEHDGPLTWFHDEFFTVTGVDVYAAPPPRKRRPTIIESPRARVLVLRQEDLGETAGEALGAFLGTGPLELATSNRSEDKRYGDAYRRYLAEVELPDEYVERMYASQFSRHFYDDHELATFRARWANSDGR